MVRVHCGIRIASAALLLNVAADGHAPRQGQVEASAVPEVIVVEVRGRRIVAAIEVITESAVRIRFHLPATFPVLSESEACPLFEVAASRNILHRHLVLASIQITDILRSAKRCVHVEAPMLVLVDGSVEVVVRSRIPVAVHIDRHRDATARHLVVFRSVRGAIASCVELKGDCVGALVVDNRSAILELDVLGEARLELRVTYSYIKWVRVAQRIGNHIGDVGPTRIGVVAELQLFLTAEAVLEVHDRRGVDDGSTKQSVDTPFLIVNFADLRLHVSADGQTILGAVDAQLKTQVVVLTYVLGVAALLLVLYRIVAIVEIIVVVLVHAKQVVVRVEDGADVAVVVAEVVAIAVTELLESLIGDGLAVIDACIEVVVVVRATVVLHFMVDGVLAAECLQEVVVRLRVAVPLTVRVAVAAANIQRHVSPGLLQPFVDLQGGRGVDVLRGVPVVAQPVVHANLLCESGIVGQRSGGELEGIVVPSG